MNGGDGIGPSPRLARIPGMMFSEFSAAAITVSANFFNAHMLDITPQDSRPKTLRRMRSYLFTT
jgi:hypothetical protein